MICKRILSMKKLERFLLPGWDIFVACGASLAAVVTPLRLVQVLHGRVELLYLDETLTVILLLDILVRFQRCRRSEHQDEPAQTELGVVARYSRSWLALDLIAAMPWGLFGGIPLFQTARLVKLARVGQLMREWRQRAVKRSTWLRLAFFAYWILLSMHWIACGWLALRGMPSAAKPSSAYLSALYWTVQTFATVGYGDQPPTNDAQILYAIAVMILGAAMYGYMIGNIASILANIDPAKVQHLERIEKLTAFMNYRSIPPEMQQRIRDYYSYLWNKRLSFDEAEVISALPPSLSTEISLFLKRDFIQRVPIFQGASEEFIKEIALHMRPLVFLPGDYVYKAGEMGRDMYFISRGTLEALSRDGSTIYTTLTAGDFFGEIALVLNQRRTASVRALSYCDLYRLDKEMFDRVLAHYPEIGKQIEAKARERQEK